MKPFTMNANSAIRLLQFVAFQDLFGVGMIIPLLPAHARKLAATHIQIGLLGSVYAAFQLFSGPFIGSLSDLKGRKPVLIFTLLICGVLYMLKGFCTSVIALIFLRSLLGIFKQTQILTRAMVAEFETDKFKQSKTYGQLAAIAGMGITLGPIVGGHVVEENPENGFKYISMATGTCFLVNACIVYMFLSPPNYKDLKYCSKDEYECSCKCECENNCSCECLKTVNASNKEPKHKRTKPKQSILQYIQCSINESVVQLFSINWSLYWDVLLLKGLVGFAMGVYYSNYSMYLKSVFDLSPKYIGYVVSYQGVITALASYFMGYINGLYKFDEDFTLRNMHVFMLSSMSLLGLILSNDIYWYLFWLTPLAISNAVGRLITIEVLLQRSKGAHRGSLIGASNSVRSMSGIIAPMVTGFICQYIGVRYSIYASLLSTGLGICLSYYCRIRSRKIKVD